MYKKLEKAEEPLFCIYHFTVMGLWICHLNFNKLVLLL